MKFLTQLKETDPDNWREVEAESARDAAYKALIRVKAPLTILPCTVYVSLGDMRHDNGTPMAVHAFGMAKKEDK